MKKIYITVIALAMASLANAQVMVTFRVDMSAANLGADVACTAVPFDPATDVVEAMGGDYNGWSAAETVNCGDPFTGNATDFVAIGSGIYERTALITAATPTDSPFKYRIDHAWGNDELRGIGDGNRHIDLSTYAPGSSVVVNCVFNDPTMTIVDITGIKSVNNAVAALTVSPNPAANGIAKLAYSLNSNENVTVKVYNVLGAEVATLVNESQVVGVHQIEWNTANVDKGIYTAIAKTSTGSKTVRVAVQ